MWLETAAADNGLCVNSGGFSRLFPRKGYGGEGITLKLATILGDRANGGQFWTHSLELIGGCTKVSPGCKNCWSEAMNKRFRRLPGFDGTLTVRWHKLPEIAPKSARRAARVWTYWNDLFHESVPDDFLDEFFKLVNTGWDQHIICTKRPENAVAYWEKPETPMNHHLQEMRSITYLVSMENQDWLYARRGAALQLHRLGGQVGILAEPMLGAIDISCLAFKPVWILCGPENGTGKRPFDGRWAMRLQQDAKAMGVPFFYKDGHLNGKRYIETP